MRTLIVLGVVGAIAQLIDGSLGMAYGVVRILAVPGAIGAFAGATILSSLPADVAKPVVGVILLALGLYVLYRFLALGGRRPEFRGRVRTAFLVPLGLVGGTLDSLGGGGWGPVGTTSLLSSGRVEPRKVVGSIDTSEFVVAVGGSLGFLLGLGAAGIDWGYALALLVGGAIVAPVAAWLVKHLPARVLGTAAGGLIVVTNARTLLLWGEVPAAVTNPALLALLAAWLVLITWAVLAERRNRGDDDELSTSDRPAPSDSAGPAPVRA